MKNSAKIAQIMRLLADAIEAEPDPVAPAVDDSAPMTAKEIMARRPGITPGWLKTHVAEAGRGARRTPLYRLKAVDAAAAGAAHPPKPPKKREITGVNEDPIEAMVRRGELRKVGGR